MRSPPTGDSASLRQPPAVPDFELLRCIGSGSYGDVWLARNVLGQCRAVKFVYRNRFSDPRPFEREFEGIQRFEPISRSHPSQLAILHVGKNTAEGCFYYVMELADAAEPRETSEPVFSVQCSVTDQSLPAASNTSSRREAKTGSLNSAYSPRTFRSDLERHSRLPVPDCVQIGLSLATALAHLHEQGLVHRDIKPSNIIFVKGVAKLGDIGLVTETGDSRSIVGTEGYLPPEGPGTSQADLYSLGKVLYEAVTGLDRRQLPRLPDDSGAWPDAPQVFEFNEIVLRACAHDPRLRYQSAREMATDLEQLVQGVSLRQRRRTERVWRQCRRGATWALAAGVILSLGILISRTGRQPAPRAVERRSTNEVANRFFDLGLHSFEKLDALGPMANFQKAIKADPNFARAHAELALIFMRPQGGKDDRKSYAAGKAEAELALKLDPSLPLAHIVFGWSRVYDGFQWDEAEKSFVRALDLDAQWDRGHHAYAEFLRVRGRTSQAVAEMREALRCNPDSVRVRQRLPALLIAARRYQEAINEAEDAISMEPNIVHVAYYFLVVAWCARTDFPKAIEAERRSLHAARTPDEEAGRLIAELQTAFNAEGAIGYWRVKLEQAKQADAAPYTLATFYAQLGEHDRALDCLRTCLQAQAFELIWAVKVDWHLDPLRFDPAFQDILKKMNLE